MPGRVVVQTTRPDHPVINFLHEHDYKGFVPTRLKSAGSTTIRRSHA